MAEVKLGTYPNTFYMITSTGNDFVDFNKSYSDMLNANGITIYKSLKKFTDVAKTYNVNIFTIKYRQNVAPSSVALNRLVSRNFITRAVISETEYGFWAFTAGGAKYTKEGNWVEVKSRFPNAMPVYFMTV